MHVLTRWFWIAAMVVCFREDCGAADPKATVAANLVDLFHQEYATDSLSVEVRKPGSAGNEKAPAIFQHPKRPGLASKIRYSIDLPAPAPGERVVLSSAIAISDGVHYTGGEDGVEFSVAINGETLFKSRTSETKWSPFALDLTKLGGKRIELALLTDALANTAFDWALWANPRILLLPAPADFSGEPIKLPFSIGIIGAENKTGAELAFEIRRQDGNAFKSWKSKDTLVVQDVSLPEDGPFYLRVTPAGQDLKVWACGYAPALEITQLTPLSAINFAGADLNVQSTVRNHGPGELKSGEASMTLSIGGRQLGLQQLPRLAPGETWTMQQNFTAAPKGSYQLVASLKLGDSVKTSGKHLEVYSSEASDSQIARFADAQMVFLRDSNGKFAAARLEIPERSGWRPIASWSPLSELVIQGADGPEPLRIAFEKIDREGSNMFHLQTTVRDARGADWSVALSARETSPGVIAIAHSWMCDQERSILAASGPNIYAGDGNSGTAKSEGLFPGLEYLYKGEPSSNLRDFAPNLADRRSPAPDKITIPFMAVTIGPESQEAPLPLPPFYTPDSAKNFGAGRAPAGPLPEETWTVALEWDPLQEWAPNRQFPTPRFSSPNHDEGMQNHRLGLRLPSIPADMPENGNLAGKPVALKANERLTLKSILRVARKNALGALADSIRHGGGLPSPSPAPRNFQEELDLCRFGFLKTVWDEKTERSQHCIGWAGTDSPGFAALLWIDSLAAKNRESGKTSRERAERIGSKIIANSSPQALTSQSATHIMQWEFPFLFGYLPQAVDGLDGFAASLIASQEADGGWLYRPGNAEQASLGQAGDSVLGTCANRAATILRYARITGDAKAWEAGKKALLFMRNFHVPRGGQTWECPMYEPDILAAAYAIRACHDAYQITGEKEWLKDAIHWAETGVPFVYLWSLPGNSMMLGATIPVFGSTFYTHTWLAVPVQWCGLVYSYHLFHLTETLRELGSGADDLVSASSMRFTPEDWKRLVELITVSGMHQQFAEGDKKGAYPDSISNFETRNPAFLNPEDILVNVLALNGYDPDIKTLRIGREGKEPVRISSIAGLALSEAGNHSGGVNCNFNRGEKVRLLATGISPSAIKINRQELPKLNHEPERETGWWRDGKGRTFVCFTQETDSVLVEWSEE